MAADPASHVVDEVIVKDDTNHYEYALHRALCYLLYEGSTETDLLEDLLAIRKHLMSPAPRVLVKTWLYTWLGELYEIWGDQVVGSDSRMLAVVLTISRAETCNVF